MEIFERVTYSKPPNFVKKNFFNEIFVRIFKLSWSDAVHINLVRNYPEYMDEYGFEMLILNGNYWFGNGFWNCTDSQGMKSNPKFAPGSLLKVRQNYILYFCNSGPCTKNLIELYENPIRFYAVFFHSYMVQLGLSYRAFTAY